MSHGREQDGYCPHCGKPVPLVERLRAALERAAGDLDFLGYYMQAKEARRELVGGEDK